MSKSESFYYVFLVNFVLTDSFFLFFFSLSVRYLQGREEKDEKEKKEGEDEEEDEDEEVDEAEEEFSDDDYLQVHSEN